MHEMDQITSDDWERLARRRVEYADELSAIGYFDRESSYMQASTGEMAKRYGFVYVDYQDDGSGDGKRLKKDSADWYKKVIATNGEDLT